MRLELISSKFRGSWYGHTVKCVGRNDILPEAEVVCRPSDNSCIFVTSQKPGRHWPRRLPGAPRAEALWVFALTFLFLLPSSDLRLTYSSWRTFGTAPTRSQLSVRQLR